jgi:hypothetical protein
MRSLAAMAERPMDETRFLHAVAENSAFLDVVRLADLDRCRIDLARVHPRARRPECGRRVELALQPFIKSNLYCVPCVFSLFRSRGDMRRAWEVVSLVMFSEW